MTRLALLTGLMAILAVAQEQALPGLVSVGCVEADQDLFPISITAFLPLSSIACQDNALARNATWVAMAHGGCSMDNPKDNKNVTFTVLDDSACSILCIDGNAAAGHCGGPQQDGTNQIFDLFTLAPISGRK